MFHSCGENLLIPCFFFIGLYSASASVPFITNDHTTLTLSQHKHMANNRPFTSARTRMHYTNNETHTNNESYKQTADEHNDF